MECAHTLQCFPEGVENTHKLSVTSLSWNESGNVIAASLGRYRNPPECTACSGRGRKRGGEVRFLCWCWR